MNSHDANSQNLSPPQAVARNVNELRQDLLMLLQLQWELLGADVQQCARGLRLTAILLAVAAALALGAVPVLLLAIAAGFVAWGVPMALALALAAILGVAAAGGTAWFAWRHLRAATGVLDRSRSELRRNIETFKHLFTSDGSRGVATPGTPPF